MEDLMGKIKDFINIVGLQTIIVVCVVVILLIIGIIFYRSMRLKVLRKRIVELENNMNAIKSLPLQYRLGRVKSIAKNMKDIEPFYEKYSKEFEALCDFQKNDLGVLLNDVDEQLFYGKLRHVNSKMNKIENMLNEYDTRSNKLLKEIEKITEIENIQRIEIIRVKETYRKEHDYYESIIYKI